MQNVTYQIIVSLKDVSLLLTIKVKQKHESITSILIMCRFEKE